jgi:peptide subunit release factor 1 (eRF1)
MEVAMAQAEHVSNAIRALITGANEKPPTNPVRAAHADFVTALAGLPPRPIPLFAYATDLEDRAEHLKKVLDALSVYLTAVLDDTAQNVPGGLDLRQIDALLSDLAAEVPGTIQRAADAVARRVA